MSGRLKPVISKAALKGQGYREGLMKQSSVLREHRGIFTIPEMVERSARDFGPRKALSVFRNGSYQHLTYDELGFRVRLLAKALHSIGIKKGDKCAILGPNSPEWGQAYLGITSAGGICVPIDSLLKPHEFRHIFADTKTKVVFVARKFLDTILEVNEEHHFKKIILLDPDVPPPEGVESFEAFLARGKKAKGEPKRPKLKDTAAIIYTSGTTGKAKGVMLSHENIMSDVAVVYQVIDLGPGDNILSVLPMHHTLECTGGFILPLYAGLHITYARSLKSRDIIEDLRNSRASVMIGVPLLFQKMIEGIERKIRQAPPHRRALMKGLLKAVEIAAKLGREDEAAKALFAKLREKAGLGHLKYFVSGGAPLPPFVFHKFKRLGIKILQGYGLTEASPVLTLNPVHAPKGESIGLPLPEVEVKIAHPNQNGVGELCFRGPMIMQGYYQNPEATREAIDDEGFLHTGDLGYVDDDGYLYICGRAKNLIVTPAGKNVYPEEVEFYLNRSPFILESMVYGIPTDRGGEEVAAVIVPDYEEIDRHFAKEKLSEDDVREIIAKEVKKAMEKVAGYKRVKQFVIWDEELPKTSTRKIKRHQVLPVLLSMKKS